MDILFSIATILYMIKNSKLSITVYIILFIIIAWFVFKTSIISDKNNRQNNRKNNKKNNKNKSKKRL